MSHSLSIPPDLMERLAAIAKRRGTSAEQLAERVLRQHVFVEQVVGEDGLSGEVVSPAQLPVSIALSRPRLDMSMSYGKLLEALDEELPIHKLR